MGIFTRKAEGSATDLFAYLRDKPIVVVATLGERRSGKSLLANAIAQDGVFPLEARTFGLLLAPALIPFGDLAYPHGVAAPEENCGVLFAEHGSDLDPRPEHVLGLVRVARAVLVNALVSDPRTFLMRWCAFIPALAVLMKERGYGQAGDLLLVARDWDDRMTPEEFSAQVWSYETMPNLPETDEEKRNAIRFHALQLFRSVEIFFLPPAGGPKHAGRKKNFKTTALNPAFTTRLQDLSSALWTKSREPTSCGLVTGRHLDAAVHDGELSRETPEVVAKKHQIAVQQVHEQIAFRSYEQHAAMLPERFEQHVAQAIRGPAELLRDLDKLLKEAVERLESSLHISTPADCVTKLLEKLVATAPPLVKRVAASNSARLERTSGDLLRLLVDDMDRQWRELKLPLCVEDLKQLMVARRSEAIERLVLQLGIANALTPDMKSELEEQAEQACTRAIEAALVRNETAQQELLARETEAVTAQASLKFRELEWQSQDHPYTNKELIATIAQYTADAVASAQRRVERLLDASRAETFAARLTREVRAVSSQCVVANVEAANTKVEAELTEALDYYRHQVLRPQIQQCIVKVSAQTRELRGIERLGGTDVTLSAPRDFTAPFYSPQFLEKTFLSVLLEKADFICSISEVSGKPSTDARLPPGVPYVDRPATPAQAFMQACLDPGPSQPSALAAESLTQFRVLSADMLDKVWSSLKRFVEEDTADLVRRTRARDELWRKVVKPPPQCPAFRQLCQERLATSATVAPGDVAPSSPLARSARSEKKGESDKNKENDWHSAPEAQALRKEVAAEVTALRSLITEQQGALLRQQQALCTATEALQHARAEREAAVAEVKQAAEATVQEVAERAAVAAREAAMEEAGERLRAHKQEVDVLVQARIAEEREKHEQRERALTMGAEARLELLNDPPVRAKLLELAALETHEGLLPRPKVPSLPTLEQLRARAERPVRTASREKKPASREQDSVPRKPRDKNARTCGLCKHSFLLHENHPRACRHHAGRYVRQKKALVHAAMQAIGAVPGAKYAVEPPAGRWLCCGAQDENATGCRTQAHTSNDRMAF